MKKITVQEKKKRIKQLSTWINNLASEINYIKMQKRKELAENLKRANWDIRDEKKYLNEGKPGMSLVITIDGSLDIPKSKPLPIPTELFGIKLEVEKFYTIEEVNHYLKTLTDNESKIQIYLRSYIYSLLYKAKIFKELLQDDEKLIEELKQKINTHKKNIEKTKAYKTISAHKKKNLLTTKDDFERELAKAQTSLDKDTSALSNHRYCITSIKRDYRRMIEYQSKRDSESLSIEEQMGLKWLEEQDHFVRETKRRKWAKQSIKNIRKGRGKLVNLQKKYETFLLESGSNGERLIRELLKQRDIEFEEQKRFKTCVNKSQLPFDFYIPHLSTLIEFDGMQHFRPIDLFGGEEGFIQRQVNDSIKNEWAKNNNFKLIRIRFDEIDNVESILNTI